MKTPQKYAPRTGDTNSFVPTVLSVDEFITQNAGLFGFYPVDLAHSLTTQLQATPVQYNNILDGLSLLRAFAPIAPAYHPSHYVLLLRDRLITGFVWLPAHDPSFPLLCYSSETRALFGAVLGLDANKALIGSTRLSVDAGAGQLPFTEDDMFNIKHTIEGFCLLGLEVMDYLLLYPDQNQSYYLEELGGEDGLDDGVSEDDLVFCYTDFNTDGLFDSINPAY